jgi:hypothetical protein
MDEEDEEDEKGKHRKKTVLHSLGLDELEQCTSQHVAEVARARARTSS